MEGGEPTSPPRPSRISWRSPRERRGEPQDEFYGERSGVVRDPFGHRWNIGHSIEEVAPEEMQRRCTRLLKAD